MTGGVDAIPANLTAAYEALIKLEVVGAEERPLLQAWLSDLAAMG